LGVALIHDIARAAKGLIRVPQEYRDLNMVMIPKPGKDRTRVKGWRPIVLANTAGKLTEKVVANGLQRQTTLFDDAQYGSRVNRSATSAMVIAVSTACKEIAKGNQVSLLGKDIVSAFNNVRATKLLKILTEHNLIKEAAFCKEYLLPRPFQILWDSETQGSASMDDGTVQGSPLSPVIWLIYIASTLKKADRRCQEITPRAEPLSD